MSEKEQLEDRIKNLEMLVNTLVVAMRDNNVVTHKLNDLIYVHGIKIIGIEAGQKILNSNQVQLIEALGLSTDGLISEESQIQGKEEMPQSENLLDIL